MEESMKKPVQQQREIAYQAAQDTKDRQETGNIQDVMQNINVAVLGLVIMSGWMFLTMKSSDAMFREALPAFLIICCLLFFKATEQRK